MQVMIKALDGAGMLEKRMEVRGAHLENMAQVDGKVICAGGLLDEEGKTKGSALIMEFEAAEKLQKYLDSEPYIQAHVWETVEVTPMNVVLVNGEKYTK